MNNEESSLDDDHRIVISLDLGHVIFNNAASKIEFEGSSVRQLHKGAKEAIKELLEKGFKVIVISKIDRGDECRVSMSLFYHGIVPNLIKPEDVYFCYERKAKGPIAKAKNVFLHVDDRVEVQESIDESGIPYKILFTESNDESKSLTHMMRLSVQPRGFRFAKNWDELMELILSITRSLRV